MRDYVQFTILSIPDFVHDGLCPIRDFFDFGILFVNGLLDNTYFKILTALFNMIINSEQQFSILAKVRAQFLLAALEAIFIKTMKPILCRQKEFVYSL